jgi:hypothetical protein
MQGMVPRMGRRATECTTRLSKMRRLSSVFPFCCGVLILGLAANAQTRGQDPYQAPRTDPYYRNRDGYGDDRYSQQRPYGYGRNDQSLIDRVMTDLNRAAEGARLDGHERRHFDEVAGNLQDFESRWARGKFDTGKLDKAIHNLEHLAEADRVRGRDRDMLARDLEALRQFRASRGRYDQNPSYYRNWR